MSTNQPPPGGGPGQHPQQQPNPPYAPGQPPPPPGQPPLWSGPAPEQPASGGRRKGVAIGVVGVAVVALVVGAGIFAWAKLSGGGPQPAEAVPANAMAYVRLDLDPSASQKLDAMSLLHKWPEFEEATGIADDDVDLRELFVDEVISSDECDVEYADDIEPWIGDRLGFALVAGETPTPMLAVQVSDEDKAKEGARKLADCAGSLGMSTTVQGSASLTESGSSGSVDDSEESSGFGVAFSGEYMLVAPTQKAADDLAEDAADEPLAADEQFRDDMDAIGDPGIASAWFDGESFIEAAKQMGMPTEQLGAIEDQAVGTGAMALRAGDDYLELVSATSSEAGSTGAKADVGGLPESTLFAASVSDGKAMVEKTWAQFESSIGAMGPDLRYMLRDFEQETGLSLPDDLATLFGDQLLVSVDSEGLAPGAEPESIADFNAGVRLTSDPDEVGPVIDKLMALLDSQIGPVASDALFSEETDDGMVIATNEDYASTLVDGGGDLGDSDAYELAVPAGDDAVNVVYANLDEVVEIAPEGEDDTVAMLEPVEAFGLYTHVDDGHTFATARLTFD